VNSDGAPDLVVAEAAVLSYNDGTVSVLLGHGDGTFGTKSDFGTGINPTGVAIGDVNDDANPDLVVANNTHNGKLSVMLGNGDGTFQTRTDYQTEPIQPR